MVLSRSRYFVSVHVFVRFAKNKRLEKEIVINVFTWGKTSDLIYMPWGCF